MCDKHPLAGLNRALQYEDTPEGRMDLLIDFYWDYPGPRISPAEPPF